MRQGMSVYVGPEATSAVKPWECEFGTADLIDDPLAVLDESGVGVGPLLHGRARVAGALGEGHRRVVAASRRSNGLFWAQRP